ncbi:MAG TPA: FRG domain-containing protein [Marinilabiliales bacterium]|jgi:hypothetical protein|nr:FRG domain-containing protein [Marinilabiliales bacterium]HAZ03611.1 FRG domain-containing protein [Marinilabiliales bacterium]HBO75358.1 FRG domain-containing protein [Marinilabiliales bacterium]HBX85209.1 FRG domain-containing protein [Marinilabiliales bacterium]HBY54677.1 FRG domain-containing protein [Marinilabiliales bacterium]
MITEKRIQSFTDFHQIIHEHNKHWSRWFYRGESSLEHKLVPKAGRPHFVAKNLNDKDIFERWCRHAVAYFDKPVENQWDLLAIAQHHGLATRLLDWTFNPMIAAFFAVTLPDNSLELDTESIIYAHYSERDFFDTELFPNPFHMEDNKITKDKIYRLSARSIVPRIMRQGGIFTIHFPPSCALDENLPATDRLEKIIIDKDFRRQFSLELSHYGINKMSLFPDLDGLSRHINWSFLNLDY